MFCITPIIAGQDEIASVCSNHAIQYTQYAIRRTRHAARRTPEACLGAAGAGQLDSQKKKLQNIQKKLKKTINILV